MSSDTQIPLDETTVLYHLNLMGYQKISKEQLKLFIQDLKLMIQRENRITKAKPLSPNNPYLDDNAAFKIRKYLETSSSSGSNSKTRCSKPNCRKPEHLYEKNVSTKCSKKDRNNINEKIKSNNDQKSKRTNLIQISEDKLEYLEAMSSSSYVSFQSAKSSTDTNGTEIEIVIRNMDKFCQFDSQNSRFLESFSESMKKDTELSRSLKNSINILDTLYDDIKISSDVGSIKNATYNKENQKHQENNDHISNKTYKLKSHSIDTYASSASDNKENNPITKKSQQCQTVQQPKCPSKSWIRTDSVHSHGKPMPKKCDPVQLYQKYQKDWQRFKNQMCENSRADLRWEVRQKMACKPAYTQF